MAIVTEYYKTREDGVVLNRTFSDLGYYIEREGIKYIEAVDIAELNRKYTETNEPIPVFPEETTEEDYIAALELLGVNAYA